MRKLDLLGRQRVVGQQVGRDVAKVEAVGERKRVVRARACGARGRLRGRPREATRIRMRSPTSALLLMPWLRMRTTSDASQSSGCAPVSLNSTGSGASPGTHLAHIGVESVDERLGPGLGVGAIGRPFGLHVAAVEEEPRGAILRDDRPARSSPRAGPARACATGRAARAGRAPRSSPGRRRRRGCSRHRCAGCPTGRRRSRPAPPAPPRRSSAAPRSRSPAWLPPAFVRLGNKATGVRARQPLPTSVRIGKRSRTCWPRKTRTRSLPSYLSSRTSREAAQIRDLLSAIVGSRSRTSPA